MDRRDFLTTTVLAAPVAALLTHLATQEPVADDDMLPSPFDACTIPSVGGYKLIGNPKGMKFLPSKPRYSNVAAAIEQTDRLRAEAL